MIRIASVMGTRPEVVKMAPVVHELSRRNDSFENLVCVTGQHKHISSPILQDFDLEPDVSLDIMSSGSTLSAGMAVAIQQLDDFVAGANLDWLIVQGDTTTVAAASLVGALSGVKVAHVEAGLRTGRKHSPFPEEINRTITADLADLHLAPTARARENLLKENISEHSIVVTGNTVVDALFYTREKNMEEVPKLPNGIQRVVEDNSRKLLLVTGHRRENIGRPMENLIEAVTQLLSDYPELEVVLPVHPNPKVQHHMNRFKEVERVHLTEPLAYRPFVHLMQHSDLIISDSGGVQEEAPTFGTPILVTRLDTERPEGVEAGFSHLVGIEPDAIYKQARRILEGQDLPIEKGNPYGDGHAAGRIVDSILKRS